MEQKIFDHLFKAAEKARSRAYAPYSHFFVGAAIRTKEGKIYGGCNLDNASFGATICAERSALFNAYVEGERDFTHMVIIHTGEVEAGPCGICRQVLREHCFDLEIAWTDPDKKHKRLVSIQDLLPYSFGPSSLK